MTTPDCSLATATQQPAVKPLRQAWADVWRIASPLMLGASVSTLMVFMDGLLLALPWAAIEARLATKFERSDQAGQRVEGHDLFGPQRGASA